MSGEKDSELVRLIRGEGGVLWPSRGERRVLKFALDAFGEPLSRFLLSGLGEEEEGRIWLFTVTFIGSGGAIHRRDIHVEAEERTDAVNLIPRRREPLLMLALLWLLMARQPFSPTMFYEQEEVLELLEWEDSPSSRLSIDETVERYADLSYRWTVNKEELVERNISKWQGVSQFVSGYGYRDAEEMKGGRIKRVSNRIDFASEFISELMSRSLFGVNWNNVSSFDRISNP